MKVTDKQKGETIFNIKAFEEALTKMQPDHKMLLQQRDHLASEVNRISSIKAQLEAQLKQVEDKVEGSTRAIQQTKDALEDMKRYMKGISQRDHWASQQKEEE